MADTLSGHEPLLVAPGAASPLLADVDKGDVAAKEPAHSTSYDKGKQKDRWHPHALGDNGTDEAETAGGDANLPIPFATEHAGDNEARERGYHEEVLALFRERLRLASTLGMVFLPVFALFFCYQMPRQMVPIGATYAALFVVCALVHRAARRLQTVAIARVVALSAYAVICAGSSAVISLAGPHNPLILGGHNHIILSLLLLPFALLECALVGLAVNLSFAWAGWWNLGLQPSAFYLSHLFVLLTTTFFVLSIAHMQAILRRRAFDATFDLKRSATKLQTLSFRDPLTGGFNRRYLDKTLAIEVARAIRFARPLSVMMFDLDNFKSVNDTRGHAAGDEVLREIWQAGQSAIREVDTLARYGGDEFSIVLPETDEASARIIAERLQEAARYRLHQRFGAASPEAAVTVSVGLLTVRPHEMIHPDKLLDGADERLYAAKRCGKNSIAV